MINIFTKSKKATGTVMIDKTLLYRDYMTTYPSFCARWRAETFSATILRSHDKHEEIERNFTNVTTEAFSRTIHERNLCSRLRKVFYERDTFAIYERDYEISLTFVARTWFTNVTTEKSSIVGLRSWVTFVTTCTAELNENYGLRSPFNWHERGLGTEHGTNVEQAVTTGCSQGTVLFYHSFYSLMVNGWMLFRISPWKGFTAKTHGTANMNCERGNVLQIHYVTTARKARTWRRFANVLRNSDTVFMFSFSIRGIILQMHYGTANVG